MPGRAPAQGGQPRQPFGPQLKAALVQAAPLFSAMAAGYSSGRGPYAYLDQGIAGMQAMQKQKRDEEAAAAAAAAFGGLVPGGMGPAGGGFGGGSSGAYTGTNAPPAPIKADVGIYGGGNGGLSFGLPAADAGSVAKGGLSFGPETGHSGYTRYEAKYGLPEGYLARTAQIESGGDPNAKNPNSSAGGLFQFVDGTAAQYGLENKFDPAQATDAAARLAADNKAYLTRVLGREPTAAELYLAHQQGAGGAAKLLANPNARAVDVVGADAVRLNGGDANMTAGQFASKWTGKFGGGSGASAAASTGPVDPLADPYVQRLMQVMAMPGLTPEQRSVVELQLQTRMGQLTAPNPNAEEDRARERRARDAELLGYGRGTPEWNQYVVTGEIPKTPTPTDDMREYDMAKSQGYTGTFQQYQIDMKKAGATNNTVTVGGGPSDDKLRGKLMEKEGELWSTYLQTGATSAGTVQDMAALDELIKVAPQGPVTGRLAEMFPGFSSAGDAFQSIVKRVAPTLRAPGSGATSDIEYDGMLRSLPALRNSPEANAAIAAMMKAKASLNVERARVIEEYQNGVIEAPEARKRMAELDKRSIMSPEVAAILGVDAPAEAAPSQAGGVPEGIDPADWQAMTPEERALWSN